MVQKGRLRNDWIDAYIELGTLTEVPLELQGEVKIVAEARLKDAKAKKPDVALSLVYDKGFTEKGKP